MGWPFQAQEERGAAAVAEQQQQQQQQGLQAGHQQQQPGGGVSFGSLGNEERRGGAHLHFGNHLLTLAWIAIPFRRVSARGWSMDLLRRTEDSFWSNKGN